jgi:hypothetical protein
MRLTLLTFILAIVALNSSFGQIKTVGQAYKIIDLKRYRLTGGASPGTSALPKSRILNPKNTEYKINGIDFSATILNGIDFNAREIRFADNSKQFYLVISLGNLLGILWKDLTTEMDNYALKGFVTENELDTLIKTIEVFNKNAGFDVNNIKAYYLENLFRTESDIVFGYKVYAVYPSDKKIFNWFIRFENVFPPLTIGSDVFTSNLLETLKLVKSDIEELKKM